MNKLYHVTHNTTNGYTGTRFHSRLYFYQPQWDGTSTLVVLYRESLLTAGSEGAISDYHKTLIERQLVQEFQEALLRGYTKDTEDGSRYEVTGVATVPEQVFLRTVTGHQPPKVIYKDGMEEIPLATSTKKAEKKCSCNDKVDCDEKKFKALWDGEDVELLDWCIHCGHSKSCHKKAVQTRTRVSPQRFA